MCNVRNQPPASEAASAPPIYTIGYGTRSMADFIGLLQVNRIDFLLDVRSAPYSRSKPEFAKEPLTAALQEAGIRYVFMGDELGGRPDAESCQTNAKVDYAKVRQQPFFQNGLGRLRKAYDQGRRVALMCGEARPEQCHRCRLIGVALAESGIPVVHIDEEGRIATQEQVMDRLTKGQWDLIESGSKPSTPPPTPTATEVPAAAAMDRARVRQVLKQTFGFADFLPLQAEIVARVLARRDTLVIMPTGGGKSLCYQLPALLFEGLTLVVSPLIALMQDQVSQLREAGVAAAFLNSTLGGQEYAAITRRVRQGDERLLYVAPETLLRPETLRLLEESRVACFAVDEAHCISEWGHDFRPEYRQLREARQRFPQAVGIALTATATPRVREDIRRLLAIPDEGEFVASFDRANLALTVLPRSDGLGQVLAFLETHRGLSGIIYCSTRKRVDGLAAELQARGWPALPYHAGLDDGTRRRNQGAFARADDSIMVATVAFGMGINKSNVRFVLHFNLTKDVESYYQEIGRAGRDGLPADCLLLHSRQDAVTIRRFIDEGAASEAAGRQARLEAMLRYAETGQCRRVPLLGYFGEPHAGDCGNCDNCLSEEDPAEETDVSEPARKFLSCVKRTGELFGAAHVIDVLRGSRSQKVVERGHDKLSTYGIGVEFSKDQWRELARQFIDLGLLEQDLQHGSLRLTAAGWRVLKGESVQVRLRPVKPAPAVKGRALPEHDAALFEILRGLRRELADEAGLPAYVVFGDRALVEMAAQFPQTEVELLEVNGVGQAKLAHYGAQFLQAIREYCEPRGLKPRPMPGAAPESPGKEQSTRWLTGEKRRHEQVGEMFQSGRSLDDIAREFSVKRGTILKHLSVWAQEGNGLDTRRLLESSALAESERDRVFAVFTELGCEWLGPVHEALGGAVAYDELHLLRLVFLSRGPE